MKQRIENRVGPKEKRMSTMPQLENRTVPEAPLATNIAGNQNQENLERHDKKGGDDEEMTFQRDVPQEVIKTRSSWNRLKSSIRETQIALLGLVLFGPAAAFVYLSIKSLASTLNRIMDRNTIDSKQKSMIIDELKFISKELERKEAHKQLHAEPAEQELNSNSVNPVPNIADDKISKGPSNKYRYLRALLSPQKTIKARTSKIIISKNNANQITGLTISMKKKKSKRPMGRA
ncbi:hypothetical protein FGM00_11245 [Aggregatimonas sangjinii]|uniref:Uncharacterized protein n=1 Tax=Aggregatimonas sangjinii TaxID=2583587 RepID=A0A5B7SQZ7_9FLAO|nr:hypothetical protein [Aggregatimonas sangjinii]QCX00652.1 hypothetical protein FGM00_11245 [Aggregatimonas sangjinii]